VPPPPFVFICSMIWRASGDILLGSKFFPSIACFIFCSSDLEGSEFSEQPNRTVATAIAAMDEFKDLSRSFILVGGWPRDGCPAAVGASCGVRPRGSFLAGVHHPDSLPGA